MKLLALIPALLLAACNVAPPQVAYTGPTPMISASAAAPSEGWDAAALAAPNAMAAAVAPARWTHPLPGTCRRPYGGGQFGAPRPNGRHHTGIDLQARTGTPIHAAAAGTVIARGWSGLGGWRIRISHGGGVATSYMHLSRFAVKLGQHVKVGQVIGYVGATGDATGPHLHLQLEINGKPVDPVKGFAARGVKLSC